jgi:hypothetical protein
MADIKADRYYCRVTLRIDVQLPRAGIRLTRILSDTFKVMARQPSALGASAGRGPGSRAPSRKASRPSGFDPSRDHESLAGGARLRVPPSFHAGVVITAPLRVPS